MNVLCVIQQLFFLLIISQGRCEQFTNAIASCNAGDTGLQLSTQLILDNTRLPPQLFVQCATNLIALNLINDGLTSSIPTEIGYAKQLTSIRLNGSLNFMTGKVPSSIGYLTNLIVLDLNFQEQSAGFYGTLPSTIGLLQQLTLLNLYVNKFSGTLPSTMFVGLHNGYGLKNLKEFHTHGYNEFSGPLPKCLTTIDPLRLHLCLPAMTQFTIRQNYHTGPIPLGLLGIANLQLDMRAGSNFCRTVSMNEADIDALENICFTTDNLFPCPQAAAFCITCDCSNGVGVFRTTIGKCVSPSDCESCDPFFHIGRTDGNMSGNACLPNLCDCANGTPVSNNLCNNHQLNQCASCNSAYFLQGVNCALSPTASLPTPTPTSRDPNAGTPLDVENRAQSTDGSIFVNIVIIFTVIAVVIGVYFIYKKQREKHVSKKKFDIGVVF